MCRTHAHVYKQTPEIEISYQNNRGLVTLTCLWLQQSIKTPNTLRPATNRVWQQLKEQQQKHIAMLFKAILLISVLGKVFIYLFTYYLFIYVCIYLFVYLFIYYLVIVFILYVCMYVCMYVCTYVNMYVCMYDYIYVWFVCRG